MSKENVEIVRRAFVGFAKLGVELREGKIFVVLDNYADMDEARRVAGLSE